MRRNTISVAPRPGKVYICGGLRAEELFQIYVVRLRLLLARRYCWFSSNAHRAFRAATRVLRR